MLETIMNRRSVRKFAARAVEEETVEKLLKATMTAPSSKNIRSTRIAVSAKKEVCEAVAEMRSTGTAFVRDAPLVFFVMGDRAVAGDMWRINCSISGTVLQLAAEELGLGSCWVHVDGRPHHEDDPTGPTAQEWLRERVAGLPAYDIMCVVAVGYPLDEKHPRKESDDRDKIWRL